MILRVEHPDIDWDAYDTAVAAAYAGTPSQRPQWLINVRLSPSWVYAVQPTPAFVQRQNRVGYVISPLMLVGQSSTDWFKATCKNIRKHLPGADIWQIQT